MNSQNTPTHQKKEKNTPTSFGRYKIEKELGHGGMGKVYKAHDEKLERALALKVILDNKTENKDIQRFIREARTMAKMNHPHIVKIYDVGTENGHPYIAMNYIQGVSLKHFLKNTPFDIKLFSLVMLKIAKAMAYAHQRGIIHRDLKPANVMIDTRKEPHVLDFGLVKLIGADKSFSKKGTVMGTPGYMSPQQAKGEQVNHLADVYALGAIYYEMLAGKPLIQTSSNAMAIYEAVHGETTPLRKINKDLPKDLEIICHKAIAKNTTHRYQSAEEFSQDIDRFLHGELIRARAANIWQKGWHKIQKNKLAALVITTTILFMVFYIWIFQKQDLKIDPLLKNAKKWQWQAKKEKNIEKKLQMYIKAGSFLDKALITFPDNTIAKENFIAIQKTVGLLAKEQKNYLLSYVFFKHCKSLGYKQAETLLFQLEQEKNHLKKKHLHLIAKIMAKISQNSPKELIDYYLFAILKIQRSYLIGILVPYLKSTNKWQRLLAIKTLGRLGNNYTK